MSESIQPPDLEIPELREEAQLIVVSGPMRSGKTTAAIRYAHQLAEFRTVEAFRPTQDTRHDADMITSQNSEFGSFPATRVPTLGPIAAKASTLDVMYIDEPFFWADDTETKPPDESSLETVRKVIETNGTVLVSTLDKTYMETYFEWYTRLTEIGRSIEHGGGAFQAVQMQGVCELCPGESLEDWAPSVSTNLYFKGVKQHQGSPNIAEEDPKLQVYVPCCDDCRDQVEVLPDEYSPRFTFFEVTS